MQDRGSFKHSWRTANNRGERRRMAGLLAWAADVVGGSGIGDTDQTLHLTPQQWQTVSGLDARAAALQHSLQQLRQRMPPSDIAQRLPHLHAASVASKSALSLELHAHSATRHQVLISTLLAFNVFFNIRWLHQQRRHFGISQSYQIVGFV